MENMYNINLDLTSYDESIDLIATELDFVPTVGMNMHFDDSLIIFPEDMDNRGYFQVDSVDYLFAHKVFVVTLSPLPKYQQED